MKTPATLATLDFATQLRRLRRERGLTQEELAERAGLSVGAISYLERGLTQVPHKDTVQLLAQALGVGERGNRSLHDVEAGRYQCPLSLIRAHVVIACL